MEIKAKLSRILSILIRYKYVVLVLLIGIAFMLMPSLQTSSQTKSGNFVTPEEKNDYSKQLEQILSCVKGAGKVQVLLTVSEGEKVIYQTDRYNGSNDSREDTVIVQDANRVEQGLVQQILSPQYRGAVVLCQGADDPTVRLNIMEAVKNTTGLGYDKICVLKMK